MGSFRLVTTALAVITMFGFSCSTPVSSPLNALKELVPVPALSPSEVVQIQLTAFGANDAKDRGIALAYRFASPRNKQIIGNYENFIRLVQNDPYAAMLDSGGFEIGPVVFQGSLAMVAVRLRAPGRGDYRFVFVLTRQEGGVFHNCWMTDGVLEINGEPETPPDFPPTDSA